MTFHDLDLRERLEICRRGTALFARRVSELTDDEVDGDTLLAEWSRKHLLAHVAHNAIALCRLLDWAETGIETPMYASPEHRRQEIEEGARQSAAALRTLVICSAEQLDRRWRRLSDSAWKAQVRTAQGRTVPASETVWMRTREVWIHAVDLDTGTQFGDFPVVVLTSLLSDIVGLWRSRGHGSGLVIKAPDSAPISVGSNTPVRTVRGALPDLVAWAAGRATRLGIQTTEMPTPPPWL